LKEENILVSDRGAVTRNKAPQTTKEMLHDGCTKIVIRIKSLCNIILQLQAEKEIVVSGVTVFRTKRCIGSLSEPVKLTIVKTP